MRTICAAMLILLLPGSVAAAEKLKIFDGNSKTIIVNGYSTSFRWPAALQRKLDKHLDGRPYIQVKSATKGGTPIAKWMDAKTGEPLSPWTTILAPAIKKEGDRPVIVLCQQSLQWAFGARGAGIQDAGDTQHIRQGADVLQKYTDRLLADGADLVFVATHIYKKPMEPSIGNERLALAEFIKRKRSNVLAGPDVWEPTKAKYPTAFAADKVHPNAYGAEIMAQKWFETLLKHDGLDLPKWSQEELAAAENSSSDQPTASPERRIPARILQKYDTNKDGTLDKEERAAFDRARKLRTRPDR